MLEDIFGTIKPADPLGRAADHLDGARSILTGIAANESFRTGLPVRVDDLLLLEDWGPRNASPKNLEKLIGCLQEYAH